MRVIAVKIAVDQPNGRFVPATPAVSQDSIPAWKGGVAQVVLVLRRDGFVNLQDSGAVKTGMLGSGLAPGGHELGAERGIGGGEAGGHLAEQFGGLGGGIADGNDLAAGGEAGFG